MFFKQNMELIKELYSVFLLKLRDARLNSTHRFYLTIKHIIASFYNIVELTLMKRERSDTLARPVITWDP